MSTMLDALDAEIEILPEQVADYRAKGWTKVEQVLPREVALSLKETFHAFADRTRPVEVEYDGNKQNFHQSAHYRKQHLVHRDILALSPEFNRAIMSVRHGSVARAFIGANEVQMFRASVFEKLPESGGGGITKLHQDAPYAPLDRHGGVSVWIALDDLEPESGTLQFVEGSHRYGSLGRDEVHRDDFDYLRQVNDSEGWTLTPALAMRAGDATIHHDLTVHGAGVNNSDRSRIAVTSYVFPAHALYNGAPHPQTERLGLDLNKPFPPQFFPLLPH